MTNARTTRRALLTSIMSLILCCTMLLSTTYAWFTDTVTSATNTIIAGNLDIELYHTDKKAGEEKVDGDTKLFDDITLWEPGAVVYETFKIVNEGNLALKYQFSVNITNATENANGDTLAKVLKVGVINSAVSSNERADLIAAVDTWQDFASFTKSDKLVATNENDIYTVVIYWEPSDIDNDYNVDDTKPLKADIGVTLLATQLNYEDDSFNKDYDKDAIHKDFKVLSASDLSAAVANAEPGDTITVMDDIELTESLVIPAPETTTYSLRAAPNYITIDLNGKTISNANDYVIENQGNIVITGNGTMSGLGGIRSTAGRITIENGNFYSSSQWQNGVYQHTLKAENTAVVINGGNFDATVNGQTNAVFNASTGATITINGGSFKNVSGELGNFDPYLFTYEKDGKVIINDGTFYGGWRFNGETATTDIYGGTFTVGFDGQSFHATSTHVVTVYGGTFVNQTYAKLTGKLTDIVATGYNTIDNVNVDGTYKVVMAEETLENLFTNVEDGGTVTLPQGTYTIPSAAVAGKDVTIEGIGDNTVLDFTKVNAVGDASITFKNLHIQGKNENIMSGFGIQSTTGHITYENCTFDGAVTNEYYGSVSYINCTFTGTGYITTYAVKSAEFVNCTFDKADSRAVLVYSHGNNPCEVSLTDCTFKAAAKATTWAGDWTAAVEVDTTNIPSTGTSVSINNCTYDANYSGIVRDKSAAGKANAVITVDGMIVLTPSNINTVTPESDTKYLLMGNFDGKNVALTMAVGVENVVFDGSDATGINELIITQNGQLIDNATTPIGERSGNVTVQNFNVLSQINVFACKTEVVVQKNTAEALMIYAGNCDVKVLNNTIDANFESHPTYRNANTTWNTNNYGIALNIFDYNLWLDGNTVTDATGHAIGINGWETTIDNGDANVIESFKDNKITVNSTSNTKRAAFKVWDDETYASNDGDTNAVNATAQAFIDAVLADGSNTFNIADGYDHTIFSFYNVNTNN